MLIDHIWFDFALCSHRLHRILFQSKFDLRGPEPSLPVLEHILIFLVVLPAVSPPYAKTLSIFMPVKFQQKERRVGFRGAFRVCALCTACLQCDIESWNEFPWIPSFHVSVFPYKLLRTC